jgi:outer membrane protein assembly factor BamB
MKQILITLTALSLLASLALSSAPENEAGWTSWRGPLGTGAAPDENPPVEWSEEKNIKWKVDLPGFGCSSPIIWKERLYVTTAVELSDEDAEGEARPEPDEGHGRGRRRSAPTAKLAFQVLCFDRTSGERIWETTVREEVPHENTHSTSSHASGSPLIDGEKIYAFFGSRGMHCLDLDGKIEWSVDFGEMLTRNQFGEGGSPALHGNTLVLLWDHEGDSFIVALDKRSGEELWRRDRDERTNWSTPLIVEVDGKPQVITTGTTESRAYDLATGKVLWTCTGMTMNCIPTPFELDGVVYLMSGFRGASLQAIRPAGARGDITETDHLLWSHGRNTSYTPSPLMHDGLLYFLKANTANLSCVDAATGEILYENQRLTGLRDVYSSIVSTKECLLVTSRNGTTQAILLGREFEVIATSVLDDVFDASAAIVGDEIFLRGKSHLYCIAHPE